MSRNRIRMNVKINLKTMDIGPAHGRQMLICICSWIHNKLALHASVVNAAGHRTSELVRPGSFRDEFDLSYFTLLELPTVVSLWRGAIQTKVGLGIIALGDGREGEAVVPGHRGAVSFVCAFPFYISLREGRY